MMHIFRLTQKNSRIFKEDALAQRKHSSEFSVFRPTVFQLMFNSVSVGQFTRFKHSSNSIQWDANHVRFRVAAFQLDVGK